MLHKFSGLDLEMLPTEIRNRIEDVTDKLPSGKGMYVRVTRDPLFPGFNEVFVYDFGGLETVFLNSGDTTVKLMPYGHADFEKAFGLEVKVRPTNNQNPAEILCDGTPLERIANLGHLPYVFGNNRLSYEITPSGPYMGRKIS